MTIVDDSCDPNKIDQLARVIWGAMTPESTSGFDWSDMSSANKAAWVHVAKIAIESFFPGTERPGVGERAEFSDDDADSIAFSIWDMLTPPRQTEHWMFDLLSPFERAFYRHVGDVVIAAYRSYPEQLP